jgi:hypothetical protein
MDGRRSAQAGAQNPAYRPTHPPHRAVTSGAGRHADQRGHFPGTSVLARLNALSSASRVRPVASGTRCPYRSTVVVIDLCPASGIPQRWARLRRVQHVQLLRQYKRWEAGEVQPKEFYQPIIAATFGTVTHAMFPVAPRRDAESDVLAMAGMDTLELVSRLQRSVLGPATLGALRIMADRLCSEYPFSADQLLTEGRPWLRRMTELQGQRRRGSSGSGRYGSEPAQQRSRPVRGARSQGVGTHRGPASDRGGTRSGTAAA